MDLVEIACEVVDWTQWGSHDRFLWTWKLIFGFHKRRKSINQLSDCHLIIKDTAPWSSVRFRRPTSRKASVHEEAFVLLQEPTTQWRFTHRTCTQTARELCHLTDSDATYWNYSSNFVDSFHVRSAGCPRQTVCTTSYQWRETKRPCPEAPVHTVVSTVAVLL